MKSDRLGLLFIGVVATFFTLLPTAYVAFISNSVTLFADFLRCFAEFVAILLSWMVLRRIEREDKVNFAYGFGKLEQLASLVVALALFLTFLAALTSAIYRIVSPEELENVELGFFFAILSVLGNLYLCARYYSFNQSEPSPVMESQWQLFRAKAVATGVVALTLAPNVLFNALGWSLYLDPLGSFLLSLFMLHSAYAIVSDSVPDLIDRALGENLQMVIMSALIEHEGRYKAFHSLKSRSTGTRIYVELHLGFREDLSLAEFFETREIIRAAIQEQLPTAVVQLIPVKKAA